MRSDIRQLSEEEAIEFAKTGKWESMTPSERGVFQIYQKRLCMPFDKFHEGIEAALGRPVWTHEFGLNWKGLIRELEGLANKPSMEDIINLIPKEKLIVVGIQNSDTET